MSNHERADETKLSGQEVAVEVYEVMQLLSQARLAAWSESAHSNAVRITQAIKRLDFVRRELERWFDE